MKYSVNHNSLSYEQKHDQRLMSCQIIQIAHCTAWLSDILYV